MSGEAAIGDQHRVSGHVIIQFLDQPRHVHRLFLGMQAVGRVVGPFLHAHRYLRRVIGTGGMLFGRAVRQFRAEIVEACRCVAPERHLGAGRAAQFLFQHVQLDQGHTARQQVIALGCNLTKLATDGEKTISGFNKIVGDPRIASEQSGVKFAGTGNAALAAHRMGDRNIQRLREVCQAIPRFRQMNSPAGQDQRPFRPCDHARRAGDVVGAGSAAARRYPRGRRIDPEIFRRELVILVADVFRHVEHDRPGPPRGGDRVGAAHQFGNPLALLDPDQFLRGRAQDIDLLTFLGHVFPGVATVGVPGDDDHRHARIQRFDHAGNKVGNSRPQGAVADAGLAGDTRVRVRHESAAAFVIDQFVSHAEDPDRLVERRQLKSGHAEHCIGAVQPQHFRQGQSAIHRPAVVVVDRFAHLGFLLGSGS